MKKAAKKERPAVRYLFYASMAISVIALFATYYMYAAGMMSLTSANTFSTICLEIAFFLSVFSYMLAKGNTIGSIVSQLGLSKDKIRGRFILVGILLFAAMLALEFGIGAFSYLTHMSLPTNVP